MSTAFLLNSSLYLICFDGGVPFFAFILSAINSLLVEITYQTVREWAITSDVSILEVAAVWVEKFTRRSISGNCLRFFKPDALSHRIVQFGNSPLSLNASQGFPAVTIERNFEGELNAD